MVLPFLALVFFFNCYKVVTRVGKMLIVTMVNSAMNPINFRLFQVSGFMLY